MLNRIGLLLPRSTDYPSMGFDMLDGLRINLNHQGYRQIQFFTENIGFGEDASLNYAKAEKLLIQDAVDLIIVYSNASNAEPFYQLAGAVQKPFIILDAGMQLPLLPPAAYCYHISLQGVHACRLSGYLAGTGGRKVLMATSFYEGGYRGPWSYDRGLSAAGGSICGNYVSGYKQLEFSIAGYLDLLRHSGAETVAACFSSYLAELFFKALAEKGHEAISLPFYCSPFMAEEQLLGNLDFPGGDFYTVTPWALGVNNEEQDLFTRCLQAEKNKPANLFHLLGWEAAIVLCQLDKQGASSLKDFSFQSPRGLVSFHPQTHYTYAPLYKGKIMGDSNHKCLLDINETVLISADEHVEMLRDESLAIVSGWKNNYLCI